MILFILLVGGPTLGLLVSAWKAWDYLTWWERAEARTVSSDYSDDERLGDTGPFAWLKPRPWSDDNGNRKTRCQVAFTDRTGRTHQGQVIRMVHRGAAVMPSMRIYYDRRSPERIDPFGFTGAMIGVVFWSGLLVLFLWRLSILGASVS